MMALYALSSVPETMGKGLEEMEVLFGAAPDPEEGGVHSKAGGYVAPEMKGYA
jgi:hypothetical protein